MRWWCCYAARLPLQMHRNAKRTGTWQRGQREKVLTSSSFQCIFREVSVASSVVSYCFTHSTLPPVLVGRKPELENSHPKPCSGFKIKILKSLNLMSDSCVELCRFVWSIILHRNGRVQWILHAQWSVQRSTPAFPRFAHGFSYCTLSELKQAPCSNAQQNIRQFLRFDCTWYQTADIAGQGHSGWWTSSRASYKSAEICWVLNMLELRRCDLEGGFEWSRVQDRRVTNKDSGMLRDPLVWEHACKMLLPINTI